MQKRHLLLILLMALFVPLAMNGQTRTELTVADEGGTNYNTYVPIEGLYSDDNYQHTQIIYPASMLTDMQGGQITKLTFYLGSSQSSGTLGSTYQLRLGTTTSSAFSASATYLTTVSSNPVCSISSFSVSANGTVVFDFSSSPYVYSGGNLLVDIRLTSLSSGYKTTYFLGESGSTYYSAHSKDSSAVPTTGSGYTFMPKTTFTYTLASSVCTPTWTGTSNYYISNFKAKVDGESSYQIDNTTSGTQESTSDYYASQSITAPTGSTILYNTTPNVSSTWRYALWVDWNNDGDFADTNEEIYNSSSYITISEKSFSIPSNTTAGNYRMRVMIDYSGSGSKLQPCGSNVSGEAEDYKLTVTAPDPCDKTIPYAYGFEDASDFSCWTTEDCETCTSNNSMYGLYTSSNYANNGSKLFIFSSYCGNEYSQYLISPKLRGVANGVHVEFDYAIVSFAQGAPETFKVGYSTTDNNVSSFTWSEQITCTSSTYEHYSANFMGQVKYIAVQYTSADSYYLFLDDFIIEEAPNCLEPTNVLASNETTTSATISWTAGGSETEWDLYYTSNPSDVPNASTTPSVSGITTNSQNLTGLTPATTYHVYVRAACSSTETSAWSTPGIFNTECYEMNLPFSYGFEDGALSVCWTPIIESPVYMSIEVSTANPRTGSYHLNLDRRTPNGTQIIVLPEVASTYALSNYEVSFYAMLSDGGNSNYSSSGRTLTVGVMSDPDDESTFVAVGSAVTPTSSYAQYTFNLSSYIGNGQYIAIKHESSSNGFTYIDDLNITALPCPVPAGLNVTNLTAASVTLNWTGDQSSYNVRYRSYTQGEPQEQVFEEGFESGSMPSDWDNSIYTGSSWNVGAGTGHTNSGIAATTTSATGSYNAYYYNSTSSNYAYLILPALDLSNATAATLTFNYVNPAWAGGYYALTIYYRVNGGSWNQLDQYITSQNTWTGKTVTLTGFDSNYEVAFYVTGYNSDYGHGVGIDDVKITYTAQSTTYGAWNTSNTNVTSPLNITGLAMTTNYEWQVQGVNCDGNGGTTEWSAPATFSTLEGYTKAIIGYGDDNNVKTGWYLIASPLAATTNPADVQHLINTAGYDLYSFNQAQELEWVNFKPFSNGAGQFNLENGKGYLYANKETVTLVFTGAACSGDTKDVTLTYSEANSDTRMYGMNLVGNPFTVPAYIDRDYYTINPDSEDFSVASSTTAILEMEGAIVQAADANDNTLTFSKTSSKSGRSLTLNLTQGRGGLIDRAIVHFDESKPLSKLQLRDNSTSICVTMDGMDYASIAAENQGEMPVSFKAEENGTYTLSFNSENVSFGYLHLVDNMTGADIDLLANPSYTFEAKKTDYRSRFKLVFATGTADDDFAFCSNGNWVINNDGNATLQVIDVNGRIIRSESINGCANVNLNVANGVYMIRLINGSNVKTQKVVVR